MTALKLFLSFISPKVVATYSPLVTITGMYSTVTAIMSA